MVAEARVRGSAGATVVPDSARLTLNVSALAPQAAAALTAVGTRSATVEALLRDHGIAEADWHTTAVVVAEEYDWRENNRVLLGRRARVRYLVTLRDLGAVNAVIAGAVADADAVIGGPEWVVAPDNPGRVEAYRLAALDARVRATAYADALGARVGAVLRIDDVGDANAPGPMPRARMMAAPASGGGPEPVHAGDIEIEVAVVVTFALEPVP